MIIPGILISIATFPGVIIHEAAHMFFCKLRRVAVLDVKFFQFDMNTTGYVIHTDPEDFTSSFLISVGPFIINSLLCIVICFPAVLPYTVFDDLSWFSMFLIWLGVSIGMHAFPSNQDASELWRKARAELKNRNLLVILSFPLVIIIYVANILSVLWFDVIYGLSIGILLPGYLFENFL